MQSKHVRWSKFVKTNLTLSISIALTKNLHFSLGHNVKLKHRDMKSKKSMGFEILIRRGRNPVILTVNIKGDRLESSQFKTRT